MSSFITCTLALTSRIWSSVSVEGTNVAGPPSMLGNRPSQKASQWAGLRARTARIASSEPGWPGGSARSCQGTRDSSEAGGSHGWCGSGKDIQQNHGSSASSESSQSTVRSATQSVWYHRRGIGLFFVSGAAVSPPGSAWSSPAKLCRCSGWCSLSQRP